MALFSASALSQCVDNDLQHIASCDPVGGPDVPIRNVAAERLRNSLLKKYAGNVSSDADERALKKFRACNERASSWVLDPNRSLVEDVILGEVKKELYQFWYGRDFTDFPLVENLTELLSVLRIGPGASLGSRGCDFYTKFFDGPLTCTSLSLYKTYSLAVARSTEVWLLAESSRATSYGDCRVVDHNRLAFVPKDDSISRVICTEPCLNMAFQLGLERVINSALKRWGIDIQSQQPVNRKLALEGSLTDVWSTIDLASASDSISMGMAEYILPRGLFSLIKLLRSPKIQLPDGSFVPSFVTGTMGNGFTFVLQTLLFSAVARAVYRVMDIPIHDGIRFQYSVYGDDIIIHKRACKSTVRILELLGFTVNRDKSFFEGPFKESCGLDAYKGQDVRGIYLKTIDTQTPYVLFNRLNAWSSRTNIALPSTIRYLIRCVRWTPVPLWEQDTAGHKVPLWAAPSGPTYQYSRWEPKPQNLHFDVDKEIILGPKGHKRRAFNKFGAWLCFLDGRLTSCSVGVRADNSGTFYRRRRAVAVNWIHSNNWLPPSELDREIGNTRSWVPKDLCDPARLTAACLLNFG